MADGLERNEKKEDERVGAEDVDAEGEWPLRDGRDIPEDLFRSSSLSPNQNGVVTAGRLSDLRAPVNHPTTMGVKSLWKLLTPVGRPVLYFFPNPLFFANSH